jgi:predicted ATPase
MKITKLVVENCRGIDRAELTDLTSIVVVVGPNGSGKSTLFDAIRLFKSVIGSYSSQIGLNIQRQYPNFVTMGRDAATIELTLKLTQGEQQLLGCESPILQGMVQVNPNGRTQLVPGDNAPFQKLFSTFAREYDELGKIDHLPPDRTFRKGALSGNPFDPNQFEQEWVRTVDDTTAKFDNLKLDLWRMDYADMAATRDQKEPHPSYIAGVAQLFEHFLKDVEFIGVEGGLNRPPKFLVRTPRGEHDIDLLSSGQQQVLMTYAYLEKRKFTNSVILFDGPELHLHAAVERKVIAHLRRISELGNQFWLATHSPEIISSCEGETIYQLTGGNPNIAERVDVKSEKIQTLQALGATVHIQMISRRIVYVEGDTDAQLLECFEPRLAHLVSFISANGVTATERVIELLNQATEYENFRAIRDRDYLSEDELEGIESKANGRLFVWRRYHIENYLLDEEAIFEVIQQHQSLRQTEFVSPAEVRETLKRIADQWRSNVVALRLEKTLNEVLFRRVKLDGQAIDDSLQKLIERRLPQVQDVLDPTNLDTMRSQVEAEVGKDWTSQWIELCPGRTILTEFCKEYVQGAWKTVYPIFIELVAKKIVELGRIHSDVQRVIGSILDGL